MNNEIPLPRPEGKPTTDGSTSEQHKRLSHLSRRQLDLLFIKAMDAFEKQTSTLAAYTKMCEMLLGTVYAIYPQSYIFNVDNIHANLLAKAKAVTNDMKTEEVKKENGIWVIDFKNKQGQTLHANSFQTEELPKA